MARAWRRVRFGDPAKPKTNLSKRLLDVFGAGLLLLVVLPLLVICALAIKLDSRGPVFYRARRVGRGGRPLRMLKFRKMHADATGPALTARHDDRFTRVGRFLARTKLDEIPQLWNVLRGDMSLVGPRPEDPLFVTLEEDAFREIVSVPPGITGLSQLAFAKEGEILDPNDALGHYTERLLPQKIALDRLYASRRSIWMDLSILFWTFLIVVSRGDVAVCRRTGSLGLRRRPVLPPLEPTLVTVALEQPELP